MGVFRKVGKGVGTVGGGLIGGATKLAGKAVGTKWKEAGEWLEDVGDSTELASKTAFDNAGQFIDGAVQSTYGAIKKDEQAKQQGLSDLKDSSVRTVKGIGSAVKYTVDNAGTTYKGIKSGDKQEAIHGLKNLGKVVAVSGLAIGVLDIVDGADTVGAEEIETINDDLTGTEHAETGVPFENKTIEIPNSEPIEGAFPVFDSHFEITLEEDMYLESDAAQFNVANDTLYQAIQSDPNLTQDLGLSQADVQALANGDTPEGYTWHHNEEPGVLQLVDQETHAQTGHTGGREIWGGGSEHR